MLPKISHSLDPVTQEIWILGGGSNEPVMTVRVETRAYPTRSGLSTFTCSFLLLPSLFASPICSMKTVN